MVENREIGLQAIKFKDLTTYKAQFFILKRFNSKVIFHQLSF